MARPKAGTKEGDLATERWKKTMENKFGSREAVVKEFQRRGRKGGSKGGIRKGFAANPAMAKIAGGKGGRISRRGPGSTVKTKIEPNADKIEKLYFNGFSVPQISKKLNIPYGTLLKWAKSNLVGYHAADDIERYEMMLEKEDERNR